MANLVQSHYLHSHKWTFFRYCQGEAGSNAVMNYKNNSLQSTIKKLTELKTVALGREQQFYTDFGVSSAKEWEAKYLINNANNSDEGKILKIINSREMISILSTGGTDFQKTKDSVIEQLKAIIESNQIPKKIAQMLLDKAQASAAKSVGELFSDMGIIGKGGQKVGKETKANIDIQRIFLKGAGIADKNLPKRVLTGVGSKYLKMYKEKITKNEKSETARMEKAIEFFKRRLSEEGISQYKIDILIKAFRLELEKNIRGENRLVSSAEQLVTGEVSEVGEVIAYINFDDPFEKDSNNLITNIKSRVTQAGRETKDTGAKSKVDTVWTPQGNPSKKYYIQNKNSNADIYRAFQLENDAQSLSDIPTYLPIQSDVSLEHLLTQLGSKGYLAQDDIDLLIYLLINYNVLSSFEAIAKGQNKDGTPPAGKTKDDIDAIISKGIHYFISDTDPIDNQSESLLGNNASTDFFIFMDRILLPKSLIIQKLLEFLTERQNALLRINTTSYLTGFNSGSFNSMQDEKMEAIQNEAKNNPEQASIHDYHNENLVSIGSNWGEIARKGLKVRKISIKLQTKNLMNMNLI